ncbi:helix-turn-helix domain-containing protein [Pedobacter aquatilis]|uniref:helix-turn-helix domain-containing protein n=1 Tax=Pedobacter aquatilis TaxID=351343 RepID=UPI00292D5AD4|nr:helix-turn-helix domain-containing protein [Pedobacter aquatilis]
MHLIYILIIGSIAILGLVTLKLLLSSGQHRYPNLMLAMAIFSVIWYCLIFALTNSGLIAEHPILYNKGLPLYYLIGPCFYLYVRALLQPEFAKSRLRDLRHFLLIIPAVLSVLPYNLASAAVQQQVVDQVRADVGFAFGHSKYIVERWHWITFPASAFIYSVFQFRLTLKASKAKQFDRKSIRWIMLFTLTAALLFVGMLAVSFNVLSDMSAVADFLKSGRLVLLMGTGLLVLSSSFFLNPGYEFGITTIKLIAEAQMPEPAVASLDSLKTATKDQFEQINVKMYDEAFTRRIENYIRQTEVFKNAGLTVSELAALLQIPNHKLSDFLNNYHKVNFNTYINNIRINYVMEKLQEGDWKQFTLEAIARDAGFSSRNTFHVYFKRLMGTTPSGYLTELKAQTA